ncbi:MAG: hypothetical protein U0176_25695 [Bacteroidia bacterium]
MRLYLDIDGVLLDRKGQVPEGALDFIHWATTHFECYWLTTHCKGDASTAVRYLARHYPAEAMPLFQQVKATNWDAMKTEGIDFEHPFLWLEDNPFQAELVELKARGWKDSIVIVDLKQPDELGRVRRLIEETL